MLFLSLGMFAAEESDGFSTILTVAQSDPLKVLTIGISGGCKSSAGCDCSANNSTLECHSEARLSILIRVPSAALGSNRKCSIPLGMRI